MRASPLPLAVLLAGLSVPGVARGYCRTSTCAENPALCSPAQPDECGLPLAWPTPCVSFSMQERASSQVPLAAATETVKAAFLAWVSAPCEGGGVPSIGIVDRGPVRCDRHEYNQDQGNANIILFRDTEWPYEDGANTIALTTVTFNQKTGEIFDADMEINARDNTFTLGDAPGSVQFDLLSVLTHETGHFLGLAHTTVPEATMTPNYEAGSLHLRTLEPDDVAAICAVYPPVEAPGPCFAEPRHGFASDCATPHPPEEEGCAARGPGRPARAEGAALLAAVTLGLLTVGRRRRARASRGL